VEGVHGNAETSPGQIRSRAYRGAALSVHFAASTTLRIAPRVRVEEYVRGSEEPGRGSPAMGGVLKNGKVAERAACPRRGFKATHNT